MDETVVYMPNTIWSEELDEMALEFAQNADRYRKIARRITWTRRAVKTALVVAGGFYVYKTLTKEEDQD